jgi:hypothetical protein
LLKPLAPTVQTDTSKSDNQTDETTTPQTVTPSAPTASVSPVSPQQNQKEIIVYVTRTGHKYHRAGCRYLSRSQIPISLSDAKAEGYTPCSVCNPPE